MTTPVTPVTRTETGFQFARDASLVKNSSVSGPENSNETKHRPQPAAPDGGLHDGFAAMAVLVLVIALIVLAVIFV